MITYASDILALLDAGRMIIRGLIRFEFGTGTYGFISSVQPLTYSGLTYQPGGLLNVSDFSDSAGLVAQNFTVSLTASPDDGLTPSVLKTIEAEDYRDRPVKIYDAHFHPDTGALVGVEIVKRGYVDTIDHLITTESGYQLVANCENRALDYTRTNSRRRGDFDQQRRTNVFIDRFYQNSSLRVHQTVYWGKETPPNSVMNNGPFR